MITITLCMIVKNEEAFLARCLDSLEGLMDEIVIVDTGSTDRTKEIAAKYTDKVFDYKWIDDFSDARNYSFSKSSMDYIYVADADEVLDDANRQEFMNLKQCMDERIEIVQMKYKNDIADNNVQNSVLEYRPKLFKRLRSFTWIDPVHETVRLEPVVFDSDIVINHCPAGVHSSRDFSIFEKCIRRGVGLSKRIRNMYARELLIAGTKDNLCNALSYFCEIYESPDYDTDTRKEAACVLARGFRLNDRPDDFFKYALKDMTENSCSEICYELGEYYFNRRDYEEAALWYYNAAFETECVLNIHASGDLALHGLADCHKSLYEGCSKPTDNACMQTELNADLQQKGNTLTKEAQAYLETYQKYKEMAENWSLPLEL